MPPQIYVESCDFLSKYRLVNSKKFYFNKYETGSEQDHFSAINT